MDNSIENLNKDKKYVISSPESKEKEPEITVHSMPARYLQANTGAQKAQSTGLLILAGGVVFIIIALVVGYYFLFYKPKSQPIQENQEQAKKEDNLAGNSEKPVEEKVETKKENTKIEKEPAKEEEIIEEEMAGDEFIEDILMGEEFIEEAPEVLFKPSFDTDQDGLTDAEEILLGSGINEIDTDGDGFGDLSEILNLYNPNGLGKLVDNVNIEKYINSKYNYYIYYPSIWLVEEAGGEDSIIFRLGKNQFIQVMIQLNENKQTIEDWYKEQFFTNTLPDGSAVSKGTWAGIKSEDGLIVYLIDPKKENIFIVTYNLGMDNTLYYKSIFEAMINSLEIND